MKKASPLSPSRSVMVRETPIELSQFLKFGGLVESGGEAKQLISDGQVRLNGTVETRKSKKLEAGDQVTLRGQTVIVQVEGRSPAPSR